ncbi:MAG: Patatin-like phospholipase family protein, partial [Thermodesulfobacteriota bacterium]|nr:Patatin-like phospholipase family protein [Thermodesulfobacteriota bacterium]
MLSSALLICFFLQACAAAVPIQEERLPVSIKEVLPKIGLALGGGGARGFAEIGVLRVL